MTASAEQRVASGGAQEAALPPGRVAVSCAAPLGAGGLGRHLQEILDALERNGSRGICICGSLDAAASPRSRPRARALTTLLGPALRLSPAWCAWAESVAFDADAARRLPAADHLIAFNGQALAQLRAARRARMQSVSLMSANSHLRRVVRQHARAHRRYPLERSWATRLLRRNLAEYALADRIYVSSRHAWESFVEEGVPEAALSLFPLTPAPRYMPAEQPRAGGAFEIVYVGSLSVVKGVPLLIDAVRRLGHPDLRLVLVGGWGTRGMRRFVQQACAEDPRIEVCPGDPLPRLRAAALCVHPSYEDGFGYAPAEAMACGVPVIVSEHTGMKDLIDPGRDGAILPTGDLDALTTAIDAAYRGEILSG
ncbi:MAG: glycosyltransferase family 4 protein [Solirubrobacterales bacterium]